MLGLHRKSPLNRLAGAASERPMRRAFTLIEIIVVIAIIGVLLGLLLPAVQRVREMATITQCQNNLRNLGLSCIQFHDTYNCFPRNTVRPWGTTAVNGEPAGNMSVWRAGTFESWLRQILPYFDDPNRRVQDSVILFVCPADPRGPDYNVPGYGFTWYVGVYSNPAYQNNGIIIDDSVIRARTTIAVRNVTDGMSNTIMIAERPPPADGLWGWWDSACCIEDTISAVTGDRHWYSGGINGNCPDPAYYKFDDILDNCSFNAIGSCHARGGNFCMGDGSVRSVTYDAGNQMVGTQTLLEALASRAGDEAVNVGD
jgi:prepilin-type N-terminal cleavage/methylation domain-containing protein/prepilin-type processing-associated H-X9-DG protein